MIPVLGVMSHRSARILRSKLRAHGGGSKRFLRTLRDLQNSEKLWTSIAKLKKDGVGDKFTVRCSGISVKFDFGDNLEESCGKNDKCIRNLLVNIKPDIPESEPSSDCKIAASSAFDTRPFTNNNIFMGKFASSKSSDAHNIFMRPAELLLIRGAQLRFFRTEKDEKKRFSSLKAKIFPSATNKEQLLKELIAKDTKTSALLSDPNISKEDKDNVKLAFTEGYLSGSLSPPPTKKTQGILNIIQQLLSIVATWLIILVIISISATSSVFHLTGQVAVNPEGITVTFDDVKGADDAKEELEEIVEFLKNPQKFSRVGGKLPKGVLLVGPPGTGKTLLARALAGEAGVPFFHTCGAEFDEMLVGQGARRVRDLFKTAKERAPCVIFIDEIDAVGCKRTNSILHPHANQTVNQLLAEMDGFSPNTGVIVLGATNRRDDLDPALLRPGRFDLEVMVAGPDYKGRKDILMLYLSKVRAGNDVKLDVLARGTAGFTGADLENVVNQAAIRAAANNEDYVTMAYLEAARDKLLMGAEIKNRLRDEESDTITAYHEAGHALVAHYTKDAQPVHKVTIVARGKSLGHTAFIPDKERFHITRAALLARLDTMMGGRAAEDLIFGPDNVTSGAADDLRSATKLAAQMVRDWGLSEKAGLRTYPDRTEDYGHAAQDIIDVEIRKIVEGAYERAKTLLKTHAAEHKLLAEALLESETLNADEIKKLLSPH